MPDDQDHQDHETHQDQPDQDHPDRTDRLDDEFAIDRDPAPRTEADERREARAARERIRHQHTWVDLQIRQAMERGEFDRLPGAGKPIEGLGAEHDPEWWLRGLIERERIAVLPASLSLRREDAELDDRLDAIHVEARRAARGRGVQRPGDPGPVPPGRGTAPDHHAARRRGDGHGLAHPSYGAGGGPARRPRGRAARPRPRNRPRHRARRRLAAGGRPGRSRRG